MINLVFVKTVKRNDKTYFYLAHNYLENSKLKIKTFGSLNEQEAINYNENKQIPEHLKEAVNTFLNTSTNVFPSDREIEELSSKLFQAETELKLANNKLGVIKLYIQDVESGKIPNKPTMRPKVFIDKVLKPILHLG